MNIHKHQLSKNWIIMCGPGARVLMHQPSMNAWRLWPWPAKIKND